jgi:transcriptional regulator with XRE-family HTH domain
MLRQAAVTMREATMVAAAGPGRDRTEAELGGLLRYWRTVRGKSQFDVALDTGISQRHISFIESGRSVPSRQSLLDIANGLEIPLRERNVLLLAAGYAPIYAETPLNAPQMRSIMNALQRVLRQHEPFPAVVLDRHWNVIMTNEAAPAFFGRFIDMKSRPKPRNLLHLMFDPKGMRPFIANWEALARSLFGRVYRESVGKVIDEKTRELIAALLAYPDVQADWNRPEDFSAATNLPVIPVCFLKNRLTLSYFSLISTVGTPQTISAQELRIECMYPADEATEIQHVQLMKQRPRKSAAR